MQLFSIKAFNFIIASAVIDTLYYSFKVLYLYKNWEFICWTTTVDKVKF